MKITIAKERATKGGRGLTRLFVPLEHMMGWDTVIMGVIFRVRTRWLSNARWRLKSYRRGWSA